MGKTLTDQNIKGGLISPAAKLSEGPESICLPKLTPMHILTVSCQKAAAASVLRCDPTDEDRQRLVRNVTTCSCQFGYRVIAVHYDTPSI